MSQSSVQIRTEAERRLRLHMVHASFPYPYGVQIRTEAERRLRLLSISGADALRMAAVQIRTEAERRLRLVNVGKTLCHSQKVCPNSD